jgi:hypothetical protein
LITLSKAVRCSVALLLAVCGSGVWAQRTVNRCIVNGQVMLSDRPCRGRRQVNCDERCLRR